MGTVDVYTQSLRLFRAQLQRPSDKRAIGCGVRAFEDIQESPAFSGRLGGDIYIYQRGDGQDVIDDQGAFSFGPIKAGLDFLAFKGGITANDLRLTRDGESDLPVPATANVSGTVKRNVPVYRFVG